MGGEKLEEKIAFRVVLLRHLMPFEIQAGTTVIHKGTRTKEMQKMPDQAICNFVRRVDVRNELTDILLETDPFANFIRSSYISLCSLAYEIATWCFVALLLFD